MTYATAEKKITDYIISQLSENKLPWRPDYTVNTPSIKFPTRSTGQLYRGINAVVLLMQAIAEGYTSPHWLTFKQCQALGGNLKGAKGTKIIKFGTGEKEAENPTDKPKVFKYIKVYTVFNSGQATGLPDDYIAKRTVAEDCNHTLHELVDAIDVKLLHGHDAGAFYPEVDTIRMPNLSAYKDEDAYAATLAHELIHAVGAKKRLNRNQNRDDEFDIGMEELTAELGSCLLLNRLGIPAAIDERVIPYVKGWIKACENDPKYILKAAASAQKSIDYIFERANVTEVANEGEAA